MAFRNKSWVVTRAEHPAHVDGGLPDLWQSDETRVNRLSGTSPVRACCLHEFSHGMAGIVTRHVQASAADEESRS
jgi:hypothetical protein